MISRAVGIFLKVLVLGLLAYAITSPYTETIETSSDIALLVDISDSMDEEAAEALMKKVEEYGDSNTTIKIFPFAGKTAPVAASYSNGDLPTYRSLKNSWGSLNIGETNLEQALLDAKASGFNSTLLISDGYETAGSVEALDGSIKPNFPAVNPLLPDQEQAGESGIKLINLNAPLLVAAQKSAATSVTVRNDTDANQAGRLVVKQNDKEIFNDTVTIKPGQSAVSLADTDPTQEGITEVLAVFTPDNTDYAPSSMRTFISGQENEKVLVVSGNDTDAKFLNKVLRNQAYKVDSVTSNSRRIAELKPFSKYSVVIFNNVPLKELPPGAATQIEEYVREGGGFAMLGGNKSFGLGGYDKTSIEEVLPVEIVPPRKEEKRLNVAVQLVLDKSGSMLNQQKMGWAKVSALETIKALKDEDYFGLIGFEETPFIVMKIGRLKEIRSMAERRVELLFPTGTTNLLPAMDVARKQLDSVSAGRKHMIIMTDGKIPDGGGNRRYYLKLTEQMRATGITISTFLIGGVEDVILEEIATAGGGQFYKTRNIRSLPRLFLKDIKVNTGDRTKKEGQLFRVQKGTSPLKSTKVTGYPVIAGYVQTKRRQTADLELVLHEENQAHPLLSSWDYGKGRSLAYTSDVSGRWSREWVKWYRFTQFWNEVINSLRPQGDGAREIVDYDLRHHVDKGALHLDLSVYSAGLIGDLTATLEFPDQTEKAVTFERVAPGRFKTSVEGITAGKYELQAKLGRRNLTPVAMFLSGELFGEKRGKRYYGSFLTKLAGDTGGAIEKSTTLRTQITDRTGNRKLERSEYSNWLILVALILILVGIYQRERLT